MRYLVALLTFASSLPGTTPGCNQTNLPADANELYAAVQGMRTEPICEVLSATLSHLLVAIALMVR